MNGKGCLRNPVPRAKGSPQILLRCPSREKSFHLATASCRCNLIGVFASWGENNQGCVLFEATRFHPQMQFPGKCIFR